MFLGYNLITKILILFWNFIKDEEARKIFTNVDKILERLFLIFFYLSDIKIV
jgi:hypothetical protein